MEKLLFALVALIFVPSCSSQSSSCDDHPCPQYQVIETNQDFEERRYADTNWITTSMSSRDVSSLIGAASRLRAFCDAQKKAGHEIFDGWPALITVVEGDAPSTSLSWFLGPGSETEFTDTSVTLEHKAAVTIYVRLVVQPYCCKKKSQWGASEQVYGRFYKIASQINKPSR